MKALKGLIVTLFYWFFFWYFLGVFKLTPDQRLYLGAMLGTFASLLLGIIQLLSDIYKKLPDKKQKQYDR